MGDRDRSPRKQDGFRPIYRILRVVPDGPVGKVGRVLVRVRGGDAPGEVVVSVAGTPETYLAYGDDGIAVGTDVLIIGSRGGRGVDVVPWDIAAPASPGSER
jgi:hypothetical protein